MTMNITENPEFIDALYEYLGEEYNQQREGDHLTDFLYCNYKTIIRKRGESLPTTNQQRMIYWVGNALQYYMQPVRPEDEKEYEIDGIKLRPDIENKYIAHLYVPLAEMKTTRAILSKFDPKQNEHYIRQMQGYCKCLGVTTAVLFTIFLLGDWWADPFPTPKAWTFEFTQEEIDDNWKEILRRRDIVHEALKNGGLPREHIMAFKNECRYCENKPICPKGNGNG